MEKEASSPEPESPVRSPPTKNGHRPRSPTCTEGLHTIGCVLVLQGYSLRPAVSIPVPCSFQHDTFPPWLGQTRAPSASVCRSNPQQGVASTTVTASHVTQGKIRIYDTPKYGRGVGFIGDGGKV